MGDAQSAQRDAQKDAEPGEDAGTEQSTEEKPLENKEPISELNGKADGTLAGFNDHSVDAAEGIPSPDKDVSNVEINANKPEDEEVSEKTIEMEAKQNEINEGFRRFFNNIGLKLTVRKGSTEKGEIRVPEEESTKQEGDKDTAKESENAEQNKERNAAQEAYDNDSTTGPTMTDGTSEDLLDTETKMEAESNKADAATSEGGHQEDAPEEVVVSPFKRFSLQLKTGFFSGLRRKKKEPAGKELVDMGKKEEETEQTVQDQQQDKVEDEAAPVWKELQEIKPKDVSAASTQTDDAKSPSTAPSAIIVTESEILSSQEKVQASPMKRLLSGSSLKKLSKKQRGRKLSDARLSDSGEHSSDHLMSSTESADNPREDSSPQSSAEATGEEEGPWASFKKLMTPKKRMKGSSSGHEEAQVPASGHEAKPSQGEQTSDHSSEEGRKRKDSSVSWEAVLCGSGRRRSRKTSDSEDESPQNDVDNKEDSRAKQGTETQLESSNEVHETLASSTRQAGSLPEGDGGSTWQSFKKLVTPKRKAKDEDEGKDNIHSDSEITHDDSSFSIKKLLPGRKKRKSGERQDQVSSDEAEKELASGDEDSETPAVVPLSEFDTAETGIQIQTQADIESDASKELEDKLKQDDMAAPVLPCDDQQIEAMRDQKKEEALKNEASTATVTNEEPDEELISKHQQLSDITEEGAITDTMATPASTNEEAARDDTIADDLIEITSEAITAPEPVDVTLADETEMISAVSQLSESSKTSGNTTPVPAELDVKDTELLLQNVIENIQMSQDTVPVCSEDPSSEKEHSGLDVEATDAPHDLAATAQPESVSDTNKAMSTDIISEVPTEEFDTAEITADDAYKEDVSQLQDTISELEVSEESRHKVECVSEVNEAVPVETLPEGEEVVSGSVVETDETEISKMDSQDAEPAAAGAGGPKDGAVEQDIQIQILVEKEDQILENVPEQVPFEDQPAVVADKQEELETVETNELASEKSDAQSLEKKVPVSEDILPAENVTDELKQTAEHLTGVTDEPENKEPQSDALKTDQHEVTEVVQEAIVESEDGSVQSLEKQVTSEDVPPEETLPFPEAGVMLVEAFKTECIQEQEMLQTVVLDREVSSPESLAIEVISDDIPPEEIVMAEPKEEMVPLIEDNAAPADTPKTEHIQKIEASQVVQAATLDSEGEVEKEVISDDVPPKEMAGDETKEEPVPLSKVSVEPVDVPKMEHIQEPETLQAITLDSEANSPELPQKEVISEDVPSEETVREEPKEDTALLAGVNVEPVDASKMEHIQEPEVLQAGDVSKEPEVLQAAQAATLDSEAGGPQLLEKKVESEDVPSEETVGQEPKEDTVPLAEANVEPVDAPKMEHIQEPETLQATTLDSEPGTPELPQQDVISEDVPPEEMATDETKEEPVPLSEVSVEPVDVPKMEHIQEPETLQAITLDSEANSPELPQKEVISEDVPSEETVREEPKEDTVLLAGVNVEPVDASKTEHIQEPEVLQAGDVSKEPEVLQAVKAATLDPEAGGPQLLEKKVESEDVPPEETIKNEPKEEAVPLAEGNDEPVDDSKIEQEPEVLQAATLDSEAGSSQLLEKEVISEDIPPEETDSEELEGKPVATAEGNVEPMDAPKTEHIQQPETLQATTLDSETGTPELPQKEEISEDVPPEQTVRDEPKQETVPLAEVNVESMDAPKTEHIQEPETLQAATLDSEKGTPESLEENVISEDVPPEETIKNEPKDEAVPLAEGNDEPVDDSKIEQEPEVLQAATLDSEAGSSQLHEKEVISKDIPPEETVSEELEGKPVATAEGNVEPMDAPKTEHIQQPETLQATTLDSEAESPELPPKKVISEDVPPEEMVKDEPKEEAVPLAESNDEPVDDSKIEQELEVLQAATLDSEASGSESLDKEVISEDIPPAETEKDEPKKEIVPLAEVNVESVDASKEQEVLQTVQETTQNSEADGPELLEKREISEDVQVETVTDEPKQAPEVSTELEKPPVEPEVSAPDVKEVVTKTETGAATSSVGECNPQEKQMLLDNVTKPTGEDGSASVPDENEIKVVDQALERNSDQKTESLAQGFEVEVEDNSTEAVEELETTAAVNVPSVMEEASCVQILEETVLSKETPEPCVDSAEASDEPTHEVQVNGIGDQINGLQNAEMKTAEVQHVVVMQVITCHLKDEIPSVLVEKTSETHEPLIDRMAGETEFKEGVESAAPLVEDSVEVEDSPSIEVQVVDVDIKSLIEVGVTEDKKVTDVCHETIEKVEVLSATSGIEDEVFNKESKVAVQGDIPNVKENLPRMIPESLVVSLEQEILKSALTEVVQNVSNQVKNQEKIKDGTEKFTEGQDEGSAVTSDGSAIPTEHHDSHMQASDFPGGLDVSLHDQKEDLEETKAAEICPPEESAVKKVNENTMEAQQTTQIITTSSTGLVTQQNTGTISSACNMESPTSFSFEVKFNIQFEKTKVLESPTSPTDTLKPVKQTDVSEVGVQVVEAETSTNATERDEKQNTEPAVNLDSNNMTKITSQAEQLDVGIRAVETITPVEEITSTEALTPSIQAAETIQPETQTESREVFLSQPELNEAKAKEPTVEENDVWQDAKEEISTQQQTEEKEPREQDKKAEHGQEVQQETHKTEGTPEGENEGEHFVAALEHPETVTAGDMTMDLN